MFLVHGILKAMNQFRNGYLQFDNIYNRECSTIFNNKNNIKLNVIYAEKHQTKLLIKININPFI